MSSKSSFSSSSSNLPFKLHVGWDGCINYKGYICSGVIMNLGSSAFASSAVAGQRLAREAISNLCNFCFCRVLSRAEREGGREGEGGEREEGREREGRGREGGREGGRKEGGREIAI